MKNLQKGEYEWRRGSYKRFRGGERDVASHQICSRMEVGKKEIMGTRV